MILTDVLTKALPYTKSNIFLSKDIKNFIIFVWIFIDQEELVESFSNILSFISSFTTWSIIPPYKWWKTHLVLNYFSLIMGKTLGTETKNLLPLFIARYIKNFTSIIDYSLPKQRELIKIVREYKLS